MRIRFENLFRNASTTYYYSSIFFPKNTKQDIFTLYAYVRTADDFVDKIPADKAEFLNFKKETIEHIEGKKESDNEIIREFLKLAERKKFDKSWIIDFLKSMESDLTKKVYHTKEELDTYIYGSAEVIGLMICRIIGIKEQYYEGAKKLGYSMQLINFIRDIEEDNGLGRTYIPKEYYDKYELKNLTRSEAEKNKDAFSRIVREQISIYKNLRKESHNYFKGIPYRQRVPIKTASDMYNWTANKIYKNPMIVYNKKVKPRKTRVILYIIKNTLFPW